LKSKILAEQSRIEIRNWMNVFLDCGQISILKNAFQQL
jgi:hypothetical protein